MTARASQLAKLAKAQSEYDQARSRGDTRGMRKAAAVIGAAFRNASDEERRADLARLGKRGARG